MKRRFLSGLLCLLLALSAQTGFAQDGAPDWLTAPDEPDAQKNATDEIVYDSADTAGTVVNAPAPGGPTAEEAVTYSFSPIDVVLVLDASGSMERGNAKTGKALLSYAQDAAIAFCQTLFALNPASRVAVVRYESSVATVSELSGVTNLRALQTNIRNITSGNMTDTGGGFARAAELLEAGRRPNAGQVVLMLSDGLANVGGDPVGYAVSQGTRAAGLGTVYTIGLVGGMTGEEKQYTRSTLGAGYQTQYYEVDFDGVEDISTELASIFVTIATSGGADDDTVSYRMRVDGGMDVRVQAENGAYLSSEMENPVTEADFGMLVTLGDDMDEKLLILREGNYDIRLHGRVQPHAASRRVRAGNHAGRSIGLHAPGHVLRHFPARRADPNAGRELRAA